MIGSVSAVGPGRSGATGIAAIGLVLGKGDRSGGKGACAVDLGLGGRGGVELGRRDSCRVSGGRRRCIGVGVVECLEIAY